MSGAGRNGAGGGGSRATMQRVAAAAGVSPMTVSNTFRYPERVQEETRARVLAVAAELGYVPNLAAGHLASGSSRVVGAIIPSIRNSSFYRYVRGLQDAAAEQGHEVMISLADDAEQELAAVRTFMGWRAAGIVLVGSEHHAETAALLRAARMPTVETWVRRGAIDMCVGFSVEEATRQMVRHLVARGRRQIGFIGYSGGVARRFADRLAAFRDELGAAGLAAGLDYMAHEADGFAAGKQALEALLTRAPGLDGVICATDVIAGGVIFACQRRGIDVPGQLAVTGWGDYEIASEIVPSLTTVRPRTRDMGRTAIELLLSGREAGGPPPPPRDVGFELVCREST
ncbi:LacI family DNA-binding transcriptional regulator [Oceanicella sp. SM1341]|uniref:LacI family DNA-binding transcriptional regulator n=1 Tax=Oceanicella sp. SM1341 TaxID=1548889 RepID=UPI000E52DF86|nr:LacI family DNA-binding transcriptional regulator [Oceanicella sp. SM1341]